MEWRCSIWGSHFFTFGHTQVKWLNRRFEDRVWWGGGGGGGGGAKPLVRQQCQHMGMLLTSLFSQRYFKSGERTGYIGDFVTHVAAIHKAPQWSEASITTLHSRPPEQSKTDMQLGIAHLS
ncbi:hypothetical protein PanWU01x14_324770 [Parasponia andersonii]|uniref:Uncharacterized protein n=1 Tax=Parasponia andersonii TaxID=3476 RepID=A0A2P5AK85_PARAD|nr:hypothetical protein PanWU01x14_324770 [Parasponia andersonii]